MTNTVLDSNLRNRLTRYLYTGCEIPKYYPGCWMSHKYFESDKLKAIDEALANDVNHNEIIDIIVQAYKDGWYTRFETIAFALIKCLMVGTPAVKEAAYKAASVVCVTTEEMLLFNKFTRLMRTGNGQGWCRHVKAWYMSKDAMLLALEMSRVRSRHGRSHKTLLRKSHVKISQNDHARDAVIKYAIFGLKHAKQMLSKHEETKPIFEYLQKVEDIRVCECAVAVATSIEQNKFTLDHVPGPFLTSQDVWNALLPQMSLRELLYNIQRIHNMGFLTDDSMTTSILLSLLTNSDLIKKSKITPIEVYITLCNYKKKSRPMKYEKAKIAHEKQLRRRARQIYDPKTDQWEWTVTRRHPKEVKIWGIDRPPNPEVLATLNKLIDQTWLLTPPTKASYLITMDMRHHMFKGRHFCKNFQVPRKGKKTATKATPSGSGEPEVQQKESRKHLHAECFYNKHVTPGHAAIILTLQLLKREHKVQLAVFTDEGIQLIFIERDFGNIEETEFILRKANLGHVQMDAPIKWATEKNQKFDVFINMVDRPTRYMELDVADRGGRGPGGRFGPPPVTDVVDHCPVRALEKYRDNGVRDAKLIVMSLASHNVATTDGSHEGVLDIVGVDEHTPKIMDAFVLGKFK